MDKDLVMVFVDMNSLTSTCMLMTVTINSFYAPS
jgi:hypothetical protein